MVIEEYVVLRCSDGASVDACDTLKEARAAVERLQAKEIREGTYEPFSYEIRGVVEVDVDYNGQATCGRYLVDVDGGGVIP